MVFGLVFLGRFYFKFVFIFFPSAGVIIKIILLCFSKNCRTYYVKKLFH